jgi:hypothetical protein
MPRPKGAVNTRSHTTCAVRSRSVGSLAINDHGGSGALQTWAGRWTEAASMLPIDHSNSHCAFCAPSTACHTRRSGASGSGHVLDGYYCDVVIVGAITNEGFEQDVDVLARRQIG